MGIGSAINSINSQYSQPNSYTSSYDVPMAQPYQPSPGGKGLIGRLVSQIPQQTFQQQPQPSTHPVSSQPQNPFYSTESNNTPQPSYQFQSRPQYMSPFGKGGGYGYGGGMSYGYGNPYARAFEQGLMPTYNTSNPYAYTPKISPVIQPSPGGKGLGPPATIMPVHEPITTMPVLRPEMSSGMATIGGKGTPVLFNKGGEVK